MKIEVQAESLVLSHMKKHFKDIVYNHQITEDTQLFVCEKFFCRNRSRCSLTITITAIDSYQTIIHTIGSGGGQGMIIHHDFGFAKSYEHDIIKFLDKHQIKYKILSE